MLVLFFKLHYAFTLYKFQYELRFINKINRLKHYY